MQQEQPVTSSGLLLQAELETTAGETQASHSEKTQTGRNWPELCRKFPEEQECKGAAQYLLIKE